MTHAFDMRTVLKGARNWCEVTERPYVPGMPQAADGSLVMAIRVEDKHRIGQRPKVRPWGRACKGGPMATGARCSHACVSSRCWGGPTFTSSLPSS